MGEKGRIFLKKSIVRSISALDCGVATELTSFFLHFLEIPKLCSFVTNYMMVYDKEKCGFGIDNT